MSTPFLIGFTQQMLAALLRSEQIEIAPGSQDLVVREVASALAAAQNKSVISVFAKALVANAHVEELYADDDDLKALMIDLRQG